MSAAQPLKTTLIKNLDINTVKCCEDGTSQTQRNMSGAKTSLPENGEMYCRATIHLK